jgi:hypothetical protein
MLPLPRVGDALLAHFFDCIQLHQACQSIPFHAISPLSSSLLIGNNSRKTHKGHLNETIQLGSGNLDIADFRGLIIVSMCAAEPEWKHHSEVLQSAVDFQAQGRRHPPVLFWGSMRA